MKLKPPRIDIILRKSLDVKLAYMQIESYFHRCNIVIICLHLNVNRNYRKQNELKQACLIIVILLWAA
jgi:hypothetical protein